MVLGQELILQEMRAGNIRFDPCLDIFQLQQHSIDLRLGFTFLLPKVAELSSIGRVATRIDHLNILSKKTQNVSTRIELKEGQVFDILPGEFVIVSTLETISLSSNLMAILYPRSSVNRRGLSVDLTGIVDSGYSGNLLIPLRNNTSAQVIRLYPGERFCQLVFEQIDGDFVHRKSRWHKRDVHMTIQKEQDNEETDLVRSGKIDSLKAKFGIHQI